MSGVAKFPLAFDTMLAVTYNRRAAGVRTQRGKGAVLGTSSPNTLFLIAPVFRASRKSKPTRKGEAQTMQRNVGLQLLGIFVLAAVAFWLALPSTREVRIPNPLTGQPLFERPAEYRQGLDLQGGLQVVLEADVPPGTEVDPDRMQAARDIIERRVNALGTTEPVIQLAGNNRIIVELPGIEDPDRAIATFGETGLLEFIDAGSPAEAPQVGEKVVTDYGGQQPITDTENVKVYHTVFTGADLRSAEIAFDPNTNQPQIAFEFKPGEPSERLATFTRENVGRVMAIVLDKEVISAPVIRSEIPDGRGVIEGNFTLEEAQALVIQLRYGALPVPLKVVQVRAVGATLGEDSVQRSVRAGLIGVLSVAAFMLLYYRLPGLLANVALAIYGAIALSLFKLIPVTLTLAGIAGFVLSVGMAVDANILIFERMKEELRAGKSLVAAVQIGFRRAWPSIRDSNASTLITCAILFWFGATFGASIVKGFAVTLAVGVMVSLFTAVVVTRTFLRAVMMTNLVRNRWWFGV